MKINLENKFKSIQLM